MPVIAKPEFSETSFAFALASEFVRRYPWRLASAPYFPALGEEKILGWDANIEFWGLSYFIQFKRAEHFRYRKQLPCYRFPVYKLSKSRQHNLLIEWSQIERLTYYCAPCFTSRNDLTLHSMSGAMMRSSKFVPLKGLPRLAEGDTRQHYVTFTPSNVAKFRSRPVDIEGVRSVDYYFGGDSSLRPDPAFGASLIDGRYLQRLNESLSNIAGIDGDAASDARSAFENAPITTLRARLRDILDVEWLLIVQGQPRVAV